MRTKGRDEIMLQMEKGFNRKGWTFTTFKILSKHIEFQARKRINYFHYQN